MIVLLSNGKIKISNSKQYEDDTRPVKCKGIQIFYGTRELL